MKDSKSASNHLDHAEAQINRVHAKGSSLSPVADLKRRHKWNSTVMSIPTNVINSGKLNEFKIHYHIKAKILQTIYSFEISIILGYGIPRFIESTIYIHSELV